jgi:ABC-type lipoprotein release transport system permease subunit
VRNTFILETFFLTFFASLAGLFFAFVIMWGISKIPVNMQDNPLGMLLVDGHIYFLPTVSGIAGNVVLILIIALFTAFFPARRAANLKAAEAFRHHE